MESSSCPGSLPTGQAVQGNQAHECHLPVALPASLETGSRLLPEEEGQVSRAAIRLPVLVHQDVLASGSDACNYKQHQTVLSHLTVCCDQCTEYHTNTTV